MKLWFLLNPRQLTPTSNKETTVCLIIYTVVFVTPTRGSCCVQSVLISILDKDGHFSQCRFELSNQALAIVEMITTPAVVEPKVTCLSLMSLTIM